MSGIGPKAELEAHGVRVRKDLPDVGKNYLDHHAVTMFWKLKHPEHGLALGAPSFNTPSFENSLPMDWMVTGSAPDADLERAAAKDGTEFESVPRSDYELNLMYLVSFRFLNVQRGPADREQTDKWGSSVPMAPVRRQLRLLRHHGPLFNLARQYQAAIH